MNDVKLKVNSYRLSWLAIVWSAMLPGFGQLYNRDYLMGFVLLILEIIVNLMGGVNLIIYYSMNHEFDKAVNNARFDWLMFYPALYAYSMWQAYDKAIEINENLETKGVPRAKRAIHLSGAAIGFNMGLLLGIIWHFGNLIFLTGLGFGVVGGILGYIIENWLPKWRN